MTSADIEKRPIPTAPITDKDGSWKMEDEVTGNGGWRLAGFGSLLYLYLPAGRARGALRFLTAARRLGPPAPPRAGTRAWFGAWRASVLASVPLSLRMRYPTTRRIRKVTPPSRKYSSQSSIATADWFTPLTCFRIKSRVILNCGWKIKSVQSCC
jgi:hypothetical protein